jgi:NTE family protein
MIGYVLSGGGARGAWEAGALRWVLHELPRRTGVDPTPRVISGTSIGALNGAWIGAQGAQGSRTLSHAWQNLEVEHVYRLSARELARLPEKVLGRAGRAGVFDPAPLRELASSAIPWEQLHARIDRGDLAAFVCAATDVASGFCELFVDGRPLDHEHATTRVRQVRVGPEHCLASAAIPLAFPPVEVEGRWYCDGALRQNTPLSPALALGVDRVLVLGVKRTRTPDEVLPEASAQEPTPAFLAGKALNALMLDPVEEDLRRLRALNRVMEWGARAYPDFLARMAAEHRPYRVVRAVHLRPREDLGRVAAEIFRANAERLPWSTRILLRTVAQQEDGGEADLLSYLLFHRSYTAELERLGWEDAAAHEDELAACFAGDAAG